MRIAHLQGHMLGRTEDSREQRRFWPVWLLLAVGLASVAAPDEIFDARGFNPNRDFFSQLPYEHIDPLTGNLLLTFTDLVLPGNAGFDLKIQRTYNSKIYRDYQNLGDTLDEDTWAGVGWTLHQGRIANPYAGVPGPIEMADGSRHKLFNHIDGSGRFVTREFWVYDRSGATPILKLPSGIVYTFGRSTTISGQSYLYATKIEDPFGNRIDIVYMNDANAPLDGIASITQVIGSRTRTINFTTESTYRSLRTMTLVGSPSRTWTYTQTASNAAGFSLLIGVAPPVGKAWSYAYQTATPPRNELAGITTPSGGQIDYTYQEFSTYLGSTQILRFRGVRTRQTLGRDVPNGTWTYSYAQGAQKNQTTISGPCGTTTYSFKGVGNQTPGRVWEIGLLESRTVSDASASETEELSWMASVPISWDNETVGFNSDADIFVPLLQERNLTRGPRTYTTTNTYATTNYNDYGRPSSISETGELSRTTARTFQYGFTPPYIVDRLASETVTVGGESFTKSYTYNLSNGFKVGETIYGLGKTFTPDSKGNVASVTDASNKTTSFSYDWGVVKDTTTPGYTITRTINADGTVASETRRGFTTTFTYDTLSRPTLVTPPVGNATITEYDNSAGTFTKVSRGTSWTRTDLDGFGRASSTENSQGVKTDVTYDACGRRTYESYPYSSSNVGTTFTFDALGRITRKTNADATFASYVYSSGIDVTVTNERGKTTELDSSAFGDPAEARLVEVTDANNTSWTYAYNALGSLRSVTPDPGAGGGTRQWVYYGTGDAGGTPGLLKQETHPESGTVSYTYWPNGLLKTRTDPTFGMTSFGYDGNNRLVSVDRPGTAYDTTIEYDASDNRTLLQNTYVSSSFGFDGANRLTSRTDMVNGRAFASSYIYDGNDNRTRLAYPSGLSVTYTYDSENRIASVRKTGAPCPGADCYADMFSYHPSGAPSSFRVGNGKTRSFTYDNRYRIQTLSTGGSLDLTYSGYDGVGNVGSITESTRSGMNQSFGYDGLDRLTTANGSWGSGAFTYDPRGNRLSKSLYGSVTYDYNPQEWLSSATGGSETDSFTYDANGNLKTSSGRSYTYTPENMLETAIVGGVTTTYRYDGDNIRKLKTGAGTPRYFVHGPGNQVISEYEELCPGQLQRVRDYVHAGTRQIASLEPDTSAISVAFASASSATVEAAGTASVAVKITTSNGAPTACPVTVGYVTADGTATGSDYTATSGTLSFAGGTASGSTQSIPVALSNDGLDEDDETFTLALSSPTGATLGTPTTHAVTIGDDDPPPSLSTSDCSVTEGTTSCTFTVSLSAVSGKTVSVNYVTAGGTAASGVDYQATSGTLTIQPGHASAAVSVPIFPDNLDENDESFSLSLSGASNASIADGTGVGTIVDDDLAPTVSVADCAVVEPNSATGECVFGVSLTASSGKVITVPYATDDGTAVAGQDYTSASGTLTFDPGTTTQTAPVLVVGDTVAELNRSFVLNLGTPVNASLGRSQAKGTITDNDQTELFTVAPCRLVDTRAPDGPSGGPILASGLSRSFPVAGICQVPMTAKAVAVNLTVLDETQQGNLKLYPADAVLPLTSAINFVANVVRSNNAIIALGTDGQLAVRCDMALPGTTNLVLDVFGYFE